MALTVTPDLQVIADCETNTDWTSGDVDTDLFVQGSACLSEQAKATLSALYVYTLPASIDLSTGKHVYQWMFIAGAADTKVNGGYRIYLESSTGNNKTWYVGGGDTVIGGWYCFVLDPSSTAQVNNGTLVLSSITKIGVQFKPTTSIAGTTNNIFWDVSRYGYGYNITSLSTDSIALADIYAVDNAVANKYGVLSESNGVYFTKGAITYGNPTSGDIVGTINGSLLVFTQDTVSTALFKIATAGASAVTATLDITNSVIKAAGVKAILDFTDTDTTVNISGSTITNAGTVTLNSNHTVSSSAIDSCDEVIANGADVSTTTFSNTTETTTGALYITDAATITAIADVTFNTYTGKYAVYIPASVTGTISFDNWLFDGSGTDVYWAGTTGTLVVNKNNGSNPTSYSSAGGVVSFVSSIAINIHVADEANVDVASAFVYVDEDNIDPYIINTTSDINGDVTGSYSGASTSCTIRIRKYGYKPYKGTASLTSDINLNVTLITDPQQT